MVSNNRKKTKDSNVSPATSFFFLSSALQKSSSFARHMDTQTNILSGLSFGIFILSVSQIRAEDGTIILPLLVLAVFSLFASLMALFSVLPPRFMRKKGQKESLLYNKEIAGFQSSLKYHKELAEVSCSLNKITQQFALELYNLSRYYYQPKRRLFKYARHLLIFGISVSLIVTIFEFIAR